MDLNQIFELTPLMTIVIFWSCVVAAVAGSVTLWAMSKQTRVPLDLNTLIDRRELMLLYGVFVLERVASALTFVPESIAPWHLVPNLGMKAMLAVVLVASTVTMIARFRARRSR